MRELHTHRMRPLSALLPPDEAHRRLQDAAPPVQETESLPLEQAAGRVLAHPVLAATDVPPFDRCAMDGYALRSVDTQPATPTHPVRLRVVTVLHAGQRARQPLAEGECAQVATGAPLPPGTDAVVPVERTRPEADGVVVAQPVAPREHVSARGIDLRRGESALRAEVLLTPARIAVAAAAGAAKVTVWRRPRVVILSTGSEVKPPGVPLGPADIYDSNGPALAALFGVGGANVIAFERVPDDANALAAALRTHAAADLVVTSGASSAGERDLLEAALATVGRIEFHGVRVKPGKPLLLGRVGSTPVVGLPGYPTSCLSDAYLFVLPMLRRIAHLPPEPARRLRVPLATPVKGIPDRLWFLPVRLENGRAVPTFKESGATTSLADAEGYIEIPAGIPLLDAGTPVDVILF